MEGKEKGSKMSYADAKASGLNTKATKMIASNAKFKLEDLMD